MVVNTESGTFHPSFCSDFDDELDLSTNDPGSYRMEKMVSGRYLGLNGLYVIREAIELGGLFSDFFEQRFDRIHELSSQDLNDFIENPYGPNLLSHCCCNVIDRENLYALIDNVFERAVRFIVVNLAAIMKMRGLGKSPVKPVMISADGSTFYKSKLIRPKLTYYLRQYLNDQLGHYCEIIHVEQGNLIGAAIAGLTNER